LTRHEVKLWNWLRESVVPTGFHFRRQVPIGPFIADFACLSRRLIVELDGEQHGTEPARLRDRRRDEDLQSRGYRVLRFTNAEIDREKQVVLETIRAALLDPHPSPSAPPSPAGEGSGAQLRSSNSHPPQR
jgi:very-short-patch-repair endonuclease